MEDENYCLKVISHIKVENHIEYFINIDNRGLNNGVYFTEKFVNLRNLYDLMKKESKTKKFPSFPPNKLFGYEEEKFVIQRAKELDKFFQEINKNPNFNKLPSFIKYVKSKMNQQNLKSNKKERNSIIKEIKIFIPNERIEKRAKLFNNNFLQIPIKKFNKEEYNYIIKENEEITKKLGDKFISLDYDINITQNDKKEIKYKNVCDSIFINNNKDNNIYLNNNVNMNNDDNFNLIGKANDEINKTEKLMEKYMNKNENKFKSLSNLIEPDFFFLPLNFK